MWTINCTISKTGSPNTTTCSDSSGVGAQSNGQLRLVAAFWPSLAGSAAYKPDRSEQVKESNSFPELWCMSRTRGTVPAVLSHFEGDGGSSTVAENMCISGPLGEHRGSTDTKVKVPVGFYLIHIGPPKILWPWVT